MKYSFATAHCIRYKISCWYNSFFTLFSKWSIVRVQLLLINFFMSISHLYLRINIIAFGLLLGDIILSSLVYVINVFVVLFFFFIYFSLLTSNEVRLIQTIKIFIGDSSRVPFPWRSHREVIYFWYTSFVTDLMSCFSKRHAIEMVSDSASIWASSKIKKGWNDTTANSYKVVINYWLSTA